MVLGSISSSRVTSDSGTAFGCGEPARNSSMDSTMPSSGSRSTTVSATMREDEAPASFCAIPFGSMIMITDPSPRMVLPQNVEMCRSFARHRLDHDFFGMEHGVDHDAEGLAADLGDDDEAVLDVAVGSLRAILSRLLSRNSGSSLLRSRRTAASLMRSMRCSELLRARTSSTTASCGIAKRSPAHCTIKAETIASVSGILMMKLVPWPNTDFTSITPPI